MMLSFHCILFISIIFSILTSRSHPDILVSPATPPERRRTDEEQIRNLMRDMPYLRIVPLRLLLTDCSECLFFCVKHLGSMEKRTIGARKHGVVV
ncbi:hypothetical protein QBC37DRAFT_88250 [Rhypophila decipiens]|uniref:Secreted protein n=1 Tax=Rhypophila decipiens TaxID=261697 RepID=A0AAN6YC57_9PEZI|nr:hypothetical protein QBC37DRAFT_88250 [Rhypophila decipiens]